MTVCSSMSQGLQVECLTCSEGHGGEVDADDIRLDFSWIVILVRLVLSPVKLTKLARMSRRNPLIRFSCQRDTEEAEKGCFVCVSDVCVTLSHRLITSTKLPVTVASSLLSYPIQSQLSRKSLTCSMFRPSTCTVIWPYDFEKSIRFHLASLENTTPLSMPYTQSITNKIPSVTHR